MELSRVLKICRQAKVGLKEFLILKAFEGQEEFSAKELLPHIGTSLPSAVSVALRRLETSQYISVAIDGDDRRKVRITRTAKGRRFYQQLVNGVTP